MSNAYAINRGSKKFLSPCGLRTLEENQHVRGFIVNPDAGDEEILLDWRIKDYSLYFREFAAVLEKVSEILGGGVNPDNKTVVRRTFRDWIGHPPAMIFEFGSGGRVYMTCICKLSPETGILRKDLGAWLKFTELFGNVRWDTFQTPEFQAFWVDDNQDTEGWEEVTGYTEKEGKRIPYRFLIPTPGKTIMVDFQRLEVITKEEWRNLPSGRVYFSTDGTPTFSVGEADTDIYVFVRLDR